MPDFLSADAPKGSKIRLRLRRVPRKKRPPVDLGEWSIGLREYPVARHEGGHRASLLARQHRRPDAEPASLVDGALQFAPRSRKPVKHGHAGALAGGESVQNRAGCPPTVDCHDTTAGAGAKAQDLIEHPAL